MLGFFKAHEIILRNQIILHLKSHTAIYPLYCIRVPFEAILNYE